MNIKEFEELEEFYSCERCGFECKLIADIKRHLNRKKKCSIKPENININENELTNKSLIKKYKNIEEILKKHKEFKETTDKEKDKSKKNTKCGYCFHNFSSNGNLERHFDTCKIKSIIEENNLDNLNSNTKITINNNNNNTNNIQNNIQNINYNITLNLDKQSIDKMLIPFYDKFDTSHISDETQMDLLLSVFYEETLKEILKNNANLNFYLDQSKENNSLIFIDNKKIDIVNNEIIYSEIWKKIKDYLLDSLNELKIKKKTYEKDVLQTIENIIMSKHKYLNDSNPDIKKKVREIINNCSEINKDKIIDNLKKVDNNLIENNLLI